MQELSGMLTVGSIVLVSAIVLIGLISILVKNYIRIAPNKAAVLYGRKNKGAVVGDVKGYRLITGGGVFKIPFLEEVQFMDLSNRVINIRVDNAPNKDGVMTTVEGVANTKFSSDKQLLEIAVERFLGRCGQTSRPCGRYRGGVRRSSPHLGQRALPLGQYPRPLLAEWQYPRECRRSAGGPQHQ